MASKDAHIQVAERNRRAMVDLINCPQNHSAWVAAIAFYRALHLVEALFSVDSQIRHTNSHETRETRLKTNRRYQQVWRHYRHLQTASLVARYLGDGNVEVCGFDEYMTPEVVQRKLLNHHLHQIEKFAEKTLGSIQPCES